jgi:hypothetical protein
MGIKYYCKYEKGTSLTEAIHEWCRREIAEAEAVIERTTRIWGLTGSGSIERRMNCANRTGEIRALKHLIDVEFVEEEG